jgi:hypothetical protein
LFLSKEKNNNFDYAECQKIEIDAEFSKIDNARISSAPWILHNRGDLEFFDKLNVHPKLGDFCDNIFVGVQTSATRFLFWNMKVKAKHIIPQNHPFLARAYRLKRHGFVILYQARMSRNMCIPKNGSW